MLKFNCAQGLAARLVYMRCHKPAIAAQGKNRKQAAQRAAVAARAVLSTRPILSHYETHRAHRSTIYLQAWPPFIAPFVRGSRGARGRSVCSRPH